MPAETELAPTILAALSHHGSRPVALQGRSGSGKTTLLRRLLRAAQREGVWWTAFELKTQLAEAIREGRHAVLCDELARDGRPLCIEHLEDLRGMPRARQELRLVLARAATRRPVLLTLTRSRGAAEVLYWLRPWTRLLSLDCPPGRLADRARSGRLGSLPGFSPARRTGRAARARH
jgi:energy-coupling factor transporter ATP-binding protein EcfA2